MIGEGLKERIIEFLSTNEKASYNEISEKLSENYAQIKLTINRNKELFQEAEKEGNTKTFKLSPVGQKLYFDLKEEYESQQKTVEEAQKRREEELAKEREFEESVRDAISNVKPERLDDLLKFDVTEIAEFNTQIADLILNDPERAIQTIKDYFEDLKGFTITFKNLPQSENFSIEEIRARHLGKLISVEARCVSVSNVRPTITRTVYECPSCGSIHHIIQTEEKLHEPSRCTCGRRGRFKLVSRDLEDSTNIIIEDLQEKTQNPNAQRLKCRICGHLTRQEKIQIFTPGNEIRVVGILREIKAFKMGQESVNLGIMLDVLEAELFEPEVDISTFTEEEVDEIKEISKRIDENGLEELTTSFAPDVYGYDEIKKAIMLQAAAKRNEPKSKAIRNKPNILMIGDPGIAKSVIGNFTIDITPGSRKATGGGSSAVGITASVVKEEESMGGYRVEPGAMVLAKEVLFLDELNNLQDEDKPKLQEGMSEQTISIDKANLHMKLKVLAGILSCANPIKGHFSEGNVSEQFNIPSPILNRFDVIFVMRDIPNEDRDGKIAELMIRREENKINPKYSKEQLRKFFVYVRSQGEPEMSYQVKNRLIEIYKKSRRNKSNDIMINPRFMEALNRLIKSSAKIRLSEQIEIKDIERALDVLSSSHFQISQYKHFNFDESIKMDEADNFFQSIKPQEVKI